MDAIRCSSKATRQRDIIAQELPYESEDEDSSDDEELYQTSQASDTSDESESGNLSYFYCQMHSAISRNTNTVKKYKIMKPTLYVLCRIIMINICQI